MPAFTKNIASVMPGYGSPSCNGSIAPGAATTAASTTYTIPNTGATTPPTNGTAFNPSGMPAPSGGKVRIRTSSVSAAATTAATVTVTDGTTTLQVGQIPATAAGVAIDQVVDFQTDLGITSVSVVLALAGTVGTGVVPDIQVSLV